MFAILKRLTNAVLYTKFCVAWQKEFNRFVSVKILRISCSTNENFNQDRNDRLFFSISMILPVVLPLNAKLISSSWKYRCVMIVFEKSEHRWSRRDWLGIQRRVSRRSAGIRRLAFLSRRRTLSRTCTSLKYCRLRVIKAFECHPENVRQFPRETTARNQPRKLGAPLVWSSSSLFSSSSSSGVEYTHYAIRVLLVGRRSTWADRWLHGGPDSPSAKPFSWSERHARIFVLGGPITLAIRRFFEFSRSFVTNRRLSPNLVWILILK